MWLRGAKKGPWALTRGPVAFGCSELSSDAVHYSVLQCVAVRCSVLQWAVVSCSSLQCVAVSLSELQWVVVRCSVLQCVAVSFREMQCIAVCCSELQCISTFAVICRELAVELTHAYTQSHVWHDSFTCVTWLDSFTFVTWLIHMYDMTHANVWHDSFKCVTWFNYMREITHSYVQRDSFICATWLLHMRDTTHVRTWHDSSTRVTWISRHEQGDTRRETCDEFLVVFSECAHTCIQREVLLSREKWELLLSKYRESKWYTTSNLWRVSRRVFRVRSLL